MTANVRLAQFPRSHIAEGGPAFEETVISPGVRYAFNLPSDAQLAIGSALLIGQTSDSPDWGMFFYCSFEHPFVCVELPGTK